MKYIAITVGVIFLGLLCPQIGRAYEIPTLPTVPSAPIPSVPSTSTPVGGLAAGIALQTALNAKIDHADCAFQDNTNETTCDLKRLGRDLAAAAKATKHVGHQITIMVTAGPAEGIEKKGQKANASSRADAVRDELKEGGGLLADSWRYDTRTSKKTNYLVITARVD